MPRKIIIKKRAAKGCSKEDNTIKLETEDFGYELNQTEVDLLNAFCNKSVQLTPNGDTPLEESVQDELELATEYGINSVEGFKDWLTLTATFGWSFIKQSDFANVEQQLSESSSMDNEDKISHLISQLAQPF